MCLLLEQSCPISQCCRSIRECFSLVFSSAGRPHFFLRLDSLLSGLRLDSATADWKALDCHARWPPEQDYVVPVRQQSVGDSENQTMLLECEKDVERSLIEMKVEPRNLMLLFTELHWPHWLSRRAAIIGAHRRRQNGEWVAVMALGRRREGLNVVGLLNSPSENGAMRSSLDWEDAGPDSRVLGVVTRGNGDEEFVVGHELRRETHVYSMDLDTWRRGAFQ